MILATERGCYTDLPFNEEEGLWFVKFNNMSNTSNQVHEEPMDHHFR